MHPRRLSRIALVAAVVGLGLVFAAPAAPARPCDTNGEVGDVDTPVAEVNRGTTAWQWQYVGVCTPAGQDVDVYFVDGEGNGTEPDGTPDAIVDTWSCGTASTAATGGCLNAAAVVQSGSVTASTGAATPSADVNVTPCAWAYVRDVSGTGACAPTGGARVGPSTMACATTMCGRADQNGEFCQTYDEASVGVRDGATKALCVGSGGEAVTLEVTPSSPNTGTGNDVIAPSSTVRVCEWWYDFGTWRPTCVTVGNPYAAVDGEPDGPDLSLPWLYVYADYKAEACTGTNPLLTDRCVEGAYTPAPSIDPMSGQARNERGGRVCTNDPNTTTYQCYRLKTYFVAEPDSSSAVGNRVFIEVAVCKQVGVNDASDTSCYAEPDMETP